MTDMDYLHQIGQQSGVAIECLVTLMKDRSIFKEETYTSLYKKCCHFNLARSYLKHLEEKQQQIYNTSHEMHGQYVVSQTYLDYSVQSDRILLFLDKGSRIFRKYLKEEKQRLKPIAKMLQLYPAALFMKPKTFKKNLVPILDEVLTTSPIKPELDIKTMTLQDAIKYYIMIEMENDEKKLASMMRAGLEEGELESFDARYPPDPSRKQIKNVVSKIIQAHEKGDIEQLITHNMEFSKITKVII